MQITRAVWNKYISQLGSIRSDAAERMTEYVERHGLPADTTTRRQLLDYANAITQYYGEAAAALVCEMYDELGVLSGATVPQAEPAEISPYGEVAKAVNGTMKQSKRPDVIGQTISRLVKQAGADTVVRNARRDNAEWAWIPSGDTCPYCLMLASRGWQRASRAVVNGNHAEHIHANCDCEFAIRFDSRMNIAGYEPEKYLKMYDEAAGDTWQEKMRAMRRADYQKNRIDILAQKRAAYAARKAAESAIVQAVNVTEEYIENATPGVGNYLKAEGFKDVNGEEEIGKWLYDTFGGDITLLAEDNPDGEPNPDYLWNGKLWDLKTPTSVRNTSKRVQSGLRQTVKSPGGIVIDISKIDADQTHIEKIIDDRMRMSAKTTMDIIIKNGGEIKVLRYKK